MRIFEINESNFKYILSDFKQGHNSGTNHNKREPKFLLNKENINNSIVYTYISKDGYEKFKFIDLFAGIGGFHQAMENLGAECVFASEIDKYAIETYKKIYGINPYNDITKINAQDIPKHDVLPAFPRISKNS